MQNFVMVAAVAFFAILGFYGLAEGSVLAVGLGVLFFAFMGASWTVNHLRLKASLPRVTEASDQGLDEDPVGTRLELVEKRLTEVQDVMIALSEKFDRWEERTSEPEQ